VLIPTNAEVLRVTKVVSDTLTLERAQEGTSARAILVGDQLADTITTQDLTRVEDLAVRAIPLVDLSNGVAPLNRWGRVPRGAIPLPATNTAFNQNLRGWSLDPATAVNGTIIGTAGKAQFVKIVVPEYALVSKILVHVTVKGTTLTAAQNLAGIYEVGKVESAATLIKPTVDQASAWETTGLKEMALTEEVGIGPGVYYVAFFANGSTLPTLACGAALAAINAGVTTPTYRFGTANSGLTTAMPAKLQSVATALTSWWVAVA
jgi:hypothetical protein